MNIPLKRNGVIRHQGHLYFIEDFSERHTGKNRPVVHVKLRDVKDGRHVDRTLDELQPIQHVDHAYHTLQYLYHRGDAYVFMDNQSYEEYDLREDQLSGFKPFLREGQDFRVMFVEHKPLVLDLPEIVVLKVAQTAAPQHSVGDANSVLKEAELENGLTVKVPMFIKTGDWIRVDTRVQKYAGKDKEGHG